MIQSLIHKQLLEQIENVASNLGADSVFDQIEKAGKKLDTAKLVKKQITTKAGKKTTKWVKPNEVEKPEEKKTEKEAPQDNKQISEHAKNSTTGHLKNFIKHSKDENLKKVAQKELAARGEKVETEKKEEKPKKEKKEKDEKKEKSKSKSDQIRELIDAGKKIGEISKQLGVIYQHARNVAEKYKSKKEEQAKQIQDIVKKEVKKEVKKHIPKEEAKKDKQVKSIKNKERIDELTKNIKIKITDPQVIKLDFNGSKKEFILAKYKNSTLSDELYELFEPITGLALDFMDYDSKGVIKHAKNKLPFIEKEIEAKIKYNSEGDILKIRKQ